MKVNILVNTTLINKQNIFIKVNFNNQFYSAFWTSLNPPSANRECRCDDLIAAAILDHEFI